MVYSNIDILKTLPRTTAQRVRRLLPWLGLVGLALLMVALARPQRGKEEFRVHAKGIAIEMCIDRSGSMQAMDFRDQRRTGQAIGRSSRRCFGSSSTAATACPGGPTI